MKVAINGFGRIGRAVFKALLNKKNIEIVAINDLTDTKTLAHLLQYDSVYGRYSKEIKANKGSLVVDGKKYPVLSERDPKDLPWGKKEVDVVIESTGIFRDAEKAGWHIEAGAKKVVISAPAKDDEIPTFVPGVNEDEITKDQKIISMASCTTNCLAPLMSALKERIGVKKAIMTTIHSYTADQNIVDGPHKDLRRARAAAINIVPTTTGAAVATTKAIPQLKGKFDGLAVRVPTPVASLCDIVFVAGRKTSADEINKEMTKASRTKRLEGIL
ncbi:type I glyceraldehyde-3-phosphate dehydrogenase, partial [Candidatus Falkowbacteria bacterium]|nr:type I glyceraldehyde-3-phosphate dehydrogenase [Candidatus Falkowbacteria bacterium]